MVSDQYLLDFLKHWQKDQDRREQMALEIETLNKILFNRAESAKLLIKAGETTGEQANDITIGIHGSLYTRVADFYRQTWNKIAGCVDQLVLVAEKVDNDDQRICYLNDSNDNDNSVLGLRAPDRPRPHRRLSVGRLSGKDLIFDRENMTVSFPTNDKMVSCITDWDCFIFVNHGQPKLEPVNLPFKVYTEDALASGDGKPMPSGQCTLIGDEMIEKWFEDNAPLGIHSSPPDTPSLWDKILVCFNPSSVASIDSGL